MNHLPFQFGLKRAFAVTTGAGVLAAIGSADSDTDKAIAASAVLLAFCSLVLFVFVLPPKR